MYRAYLDRRIFRKKASVSIRFFSYNEVKRSSPNRSRLMTLLRTMGPRWIQLWHAIVYDEMDKELAKHFYLFDSKRAKVSCDNSF